MQTVVNLMFVGAGGFIGAISRFLVSVWVGQRWGRVFPFGTFVANVLGCFLIGLAMTVFNERIIVSPHVRLLIGVGFIGAFTTFSTFEYETGALMMDGEWLMAFLNVVGSLTAGFIALKAGELLAKTI
ncbi:MAG: fluoride efflux transporter CrcB, partial [Nitrospirae bacterium]